MKKILATLLFAAMLLGMAHAQACDVSKFDNGETEKTISGFPSDLKFTMQQNATNISGSFKISDVQLNQKLDLVFIIDSSSSCKTNVRNCWEAVCDHTDEISSGITSVTGITTGNINQKILGMNGQDNRPPEYLTSCITASGMDYLKWDDDLVSGNAAKVGLAQDFWGKAKTCCKAP